MWRGPNQGTVSLEPPGWPRTGSQALRRRAHGAPIGDLDQRTESPMKQDHCVCVLIPYMDGLGTWSGYWSFQ